MLPALLRRYWLRLWLRGVGYADRHRQLDLLYAVGDPWRMDSARERGRFAWTNEIIAEHLSPVRSILEIGCGEGHQTRYLTEICPAVYGIDVSERAVQRAARRCSAARFAVGDLFDYPFADAPPTVDLVVACEVLYYMKDIDAVVRRMSRLGAACLVTYFSGQEARLDPYFAALGDCRTSRFRGEGAAWTAVWWRNPPSKTSLED